MRSGSGRGQSSVVFKFTTQGMGHGHFDRLSYSFYDNGNEILTDYGSVRFLNVESKDGGKYLPENKTWACQTIAHNTVTLNGKSQNDANTDKSERTHPWLKYYDLKDPECQVVSAADSGSYKDAVLSRTMASVIFKGKHFLIDLFRTDSGSPVDADLPWYFSGQVISTSFSYTKELNSKKVLGENNGFQHLWNDASFNCKDPLAAVTIMNGTRFYTLTMVTDSKSEIVFVSTGANDPDFNLRNEQGIILRKKQSSAPVFLSVLEAHGEYQPGNETVDQSSGSVRNIELLASQPDCSVLKVTLSDGSKFRMALSHQADTGRTYSVKTADGDIIWKGNYKLIKE
jgi:hypothetical protein